MLLLTYQSPQGLRLGIKTARGILDVAGALGPDRAAGVPATMADFIAGGPAGRASLGEFVTQAIGESALKASFVAESGLRYGPCVPDPGKIICLGFNYQSHAAESGKAPPQWPVLFSKFNNSVAAAGEPIPLPSSAAEYDYEAEMGVIIGQRARSVAESEALGYVLGYCTANDLSARDLQFRSTQFLLGKSLDKFFPIGPYLVTADEIPDPQTLSIRCWVNGDLRQEASTREMVFSVAYLVSYLSQYMTLEPGDIISTGTPAGVIHYRSQKDWLVPGDEVTIEVEKLGRLTNVMARPS